MLGGQGFTSCVVFFNARLKQLKKKLRAVTSGKIRLEHFIYESKNKVLLSLSAWTLIRAHNHCQRDSPHAEEFIQCSQCSKTIKIY